MAPVSIFKTKTVCSSLFAILLLGTAIQTSAEPTVEQDVIYGHKDGMALVYHVVTPEEPNNAAVLLMISGGWNSWRLSEEWLVGWVSFLCDAGFTVFAVNHGSAPRFKVPDAVADVRRAVRHIKANAETYNIDPN